MLEGDWIYRLGVAACTHSWNAVSFTLVDNVVDVSAAFSHPLQPSFTFPSLHDGQQHHRYPGWAPESRGCGTIRLLSSCFATISLCKWSAIHLNIPVPGDSEKRILWVRIVIVMFCVLAPEVFAITALSDLTQSLQLQKKIWVLKCMHERRQYKLRRLVGR